MAVSADEGWISKDDEHAPVPEEAADQTALPPTIDLQRLADKVYQLMRDELRVEQARGEHIFRRRGQ